MSLRWAPIGACCSVVNHCLRGWIIGHRFCVVNILGPGARLQTHRGNSCTSLRSTFLLPGVTARWAGIAQPNSIRSADWPLAAGPVSEARLAACGSGLQGSGVQTAVFVISFHPLVTCAKPLL